MKLWCIHIHGPDDIHAAPSEAVARHMAEKHNSAMCDHFKDRAELTISPELVMATVIEWPHDSESHAQAVADFDYEEWGIDRPAA